MRILALLNCGAGPAGKSASAEREAQVRAAFDLAGVRAEVRSLDGNAIQANARAAIDQVDVVVAAGGDGTVSAIASQLTGTSTPLGVLPCGTLNHFAKDLGLPLALNDAASVIVRGTARVVDVAEVNGRVFINNSSIGLYPRAVEHRDQQMEHLGRGKWMSMLVAWISLFRRYPTVTVRMVNDAGDSTTCTTPFVFVGNNRYEVDLLNLGARAALDRGELSVYFTRRTGRWSLVRLAIRTLFNRLDQSRDFEMVSVKELWIETGKHSLSVAADGETVRLAPPLHYRIRPRELRVIAEPPRR